MKKLLILSTCLIPSLAFANLGDSREKSKGRYGAPLATEENLCLYKNEGCFIVQWYDAGGFCEVMTYFKPDTFMPQEIDGLCTANFPATIRKEDWVTKKTDDPDSHAWETKDHRWFYLVGSAYPQGSAVMLGSVFGVAQQRREQESMNKIIAALREEAQMDIQYLPRAPAVLGILE
jgi:hypothetical protein